MVKKRKDKQKKINNKTINMIMIVLTSMVLIISPIMMALTPRSDLFNLLTLQSAICFSIVNIILNTALYVRGNYSA